MPHIILAHEDMKICPLVALGGYVGMFADKGICYTRWKGRNVIPSNLKMLETLLIMKMKEMKAKYQMSQDSLDLENSMCKNKTYIRA